MERPMTPASAPTPLTDPLQAACALEPLIRATVDEAEAARRFPSSVIAAMADARIFSLLVPRVAGGVEVDPITMLDVVEAVSRVDGSAGWLAMIGSGAGFITGYLATDVIRELLVEPDTSLCGNLAAQAGRAVAVPGGYRVTGRWPFVSGCEHSSWMAGNARVFDGDIQRIDGDGIPVARIMVFPSDAARIIDTWSATGLRATGSHDVAVADVFVPAERSLSWLEEPKQPGPLYRLRFFLIAHAAHALGIARTAIDSLVDLAEHKIPTRTTTTLRDRPLVQAHIAQAEGLVHAARSFMWQTTAEVWELLCADRPVTMRHRALLRLATTVAVQNAAQAVDLMWAAAGSSPVYTSSPLERCFRDIHVATQHAMVGIFSLETIGAALINPGHTRAAEIALI
jgi:alkylation response protein AidB-like acyl-CoA dehydrogenase